MTAVENEKIEYRVREVKRYIVTRFESSEYIREDGGRRSSVGCDTKGEFENATTAYEVASALCKMEHQNKGWPPGDGRIKYPEHPTASLATGNGTVLEDQ